MNFSNINPEEEMSMEDILSSIRKYVSEEDEKKEIKLSHSGDDLPHLQEHVIKLDESNIITASSVSSGIVKKEDPVIYDEKSSLSETVISEKASKKPGPFDQLTSALNAYGKNKTEEAKEKKGSVTVDQLFSTIAEKIIQKWVDENLNELVEKVVLREIEKMKSE